jgi:hypothetical protein
LLSASIAGAAAQTTDLAAEGKAWWAHIQYLADDKLEGRNVGTPGFEAALQYVEGQFKQIGLKPAGDGGYRQTVMLENRSLVQAETKLAARAQWRRTALAVGQDATISARGELNGSLEAPMVFLGYGMSIPEAGWDDFAGQNLKGKIAVYINAFPPVTVSDNVKSHVNTADERWLALKRAGAIGVATIAAPRAGAAGNRGAGAANTGRGGGAGAAATPTPTPTPPTTPTPTPATTPACRRRPGSRRRTGADGHARGSRVERRSRRGRRDVADRARRGRRAGRARGHTLEELNQLVADGKPLPRFAIPGHAQGPRRAHP